MEKAMLISRKLNYLIVLILAALFVTYLAGCSKKQKDPLVVYAGKGLKNAVDEIKQIFEKQEGIPLSIIYAGSNTLLTTIQKTGKGDVFIPGSQSYVKKAGDLIIADYYVGLHIPAFAVKSKNSKGIDNYADLLKPGVRLAVANKDMAAIGRVGEAILEKAGPQDNFRKNIVVKSSTVNELLQLINDDSVDGALIWTDMLQWDKAKDLKLIKIPKDLNLPKEIRVCTLSTTTSPEKAKKFTDFVASKGQEIFLKHGFGDR